MPWLFAMLATSMPPAASAVSADAGARNVNSFGAGVPRSVIAVSRLPTVRSAAPSTRRDRREHASPGPRASLSRSTPSKWMSPAKANVTGCPLPRRPIVVVVAAVRRRRRRASVVGRRRGDLERLGRCRSSRPQQHRGRDHAADDEHREDRDEDPAAHRAHRTERRSPRSASRSERRGTVRTLAPMRVPELTPRAFRRLTL